MRGISPYVFWFTILVIALSITILVARANSQRADREKALRLKAWEENLRKDLELSELRKEHAQTISAKDGEYAKLVERMKGLAIIFEQRKVQFPWLASAIADFHALEAERDAKILETKKHPAVKAANEVREHSRKRRDAEFNLRVMRYRLEYYENIFPWIIDYVGDDVPDTAIDIGVSQVDLTDDPVKGWLNDSEYRNLAAAERNQLALDRWRRTKKTRWQIGRDYERFIGYNYETLGYDVSFTGAIEGLQDMGRDVIARRESELCVIQRKYWSQEKIIHEKHIFQLFGSTLEYAFRLGLFNEMTQLSLFKDPIKTIGARAVLFTSTRVSDVAKDVAKKLKVECHENVRMSDYPLVKCNISLRDGQKIYHLPFDQQYDRTKIKPANGEKYVYTVAEAEQAGFRRAWKWRAD
jgi:hypothetical protein